MAWTKMRLCIFLMIWTGTTVANYDKTIRMHLVRGYLANVNDHGVPIANRNFIHFNLRTCSGIYLSLQSTWNVTSGKHLIVELRPRVALLYDCSDQPEPVCVRRPTTVKEKFIFTCNVTFLLKVSWSDGGDFEFSRGESLNAKSRRLISCGGGPKVEKLFTYKTKKKMKMLYLAFGPLGSGQIYVNVTYSTKMPYKEIKSLSLMIRETKRPKILVHRLREFHKNEVIKLVSLTPDTAVLTTRGPSLILSKPLDYETERTHVIDMVLQGDVLTLKLRVVLRVIDVIEHGLNITLVRKSEMVEELPVGTILLPFVMAVNMKLGDRVLFKLHDNSFFKMEESTGAMTVLKRVDRDAPGNVKKIHIVLEITNRAESRKIKFTINVIDINDNQPTFENRLHRIEMPFGANASSNVVTRFKVADKDLNSGLQLQILDGSTSLFYLNSSMLCVHVDKLMNVKTLRNNDWTFTVNVLLRDKPKFGSSRQSFSTVVLTTPPPEDIDSSFQAENLPPLQIPEDTSIGQVILTLSGVLNLPSKYSQGYQFSLHSGNSDCENGKLATNYFGIDQYNGNVMVGAKLDADIETKGCRDMALIFNITNILSRDSDIVAYINITITDINDNPPIFQEPRVDILIPCDLHQGSASNDKAKQTFTKKIPIHVSDVESDVIVSMELVHWNHFVYNLTKKNADLWVLGISVNPQMRLEKVDGDVVVLLAVDEGVAPLTSTALVTIRQNCTASSHGQHSQELLDVDGASKFLISDADNTTFTKAYRKPTSTTQPSRPTTHDLLRLSEDTEMSVGIKQPSTICKTYKIGLTTRQTSSLSATQRTEAVTVQSSLHTTESTLSPCCPCTITERPLSIPEVVDIQKVFSLAANKGDISSYNFLPLGRSAGTPGFWRNGTEANWGNNKTSRKPGKSLIVQYMPIALCVIFALVLLILLACCIRRKLKEKQTSSQLSPCEDEERQEPT